MANTYRVEFTKDIVDGPRKGLQLRDSYHVANATQATKWALVLAFEGLQIDRITGDSYFARNVDIVPIECELSALVEGGGREWDEYDQADLRYDLEVEASL